MLRNSMRGVMLIEALVALVVVSLGLLGVSKLHSYVFEEMAHGEMRSEAMVLAESTIERLRNSDVEGDLSPVSIEGKSAEYTVNIIVNPINSNLKDITVSVSWLDRRAEQHNLGITQTVAWDQPGLIGLGDADRSALEDMMPLGQAKRGDGFDIETNLDQVDVIVGEDSVTKLIDTDSEDVLLYLEPFEGEAQKFVTIEGYVFLDDELMQGNQSIDDELIDVRLSNEGRCVRAGSAASTSAGLHAIEYVCYVGAGWYGNIGVITPGGQVCTGTSGVDDNGWTTSHHPRLGSVRQYRGFSLLMDELVFRGVARDSVYPDGGANPQSAGADGSWRHDFLVTRLSGQSKTCDDKLSEYSEVFSGFTNGGSDGNYGENVCIHPVRGGFTDDEVLCPQRWRSLLVNGLVNEHFESVSATDVKVDVVGEQGRCTVAEGVYRCEFDENLSGSIVTLRNTGSDNGEQMCVEAEVALPSSYTQFNLTNANVEECEDA